jgi:hypothetical protein
MRYGARSSNVVHARFYEGGSFSFENFGGLQTRIIWFTKLFIIELYILLKLNKITYGIYFRGTPPEVPLIL